MFIEMASRNNELETQVANLKTEVAVVNAKVTENHKMLTVLWDDFLRNRHDNIAKLNIEVN